MELEKPPRTYDDVQWEKMVSDVNTGRNLLSLEPKELVPWKTEDDELAAFAAAGGDDELVDNPQPA